MTFDRVAGLPRHPHDGADIAGDMPSVKSVHGVTLRTHAARHALGGDDEVIAGWQDWAIDYTPGGTTVGNGVSVARYVEIGVLVTCWISFTLGSTSAQGTHIIFTLPVSASSSYNTGVPLGSAALVDATGDPYAGSVRWQSATQADIEVHQASATDTTKQPITSTKPFTWTTDDRITATFVYEAA